MHVSYMAFKLHNYVTPVKLLYYYIQFCFMYGMPDSLIFSVQRVYIVAKPHDLINGQQIV
jgi:hypothetical protein